MKLEDFKVLDSEEIYKGKIVHLVKDKVSLPNGNHSYWELIHHIGAAAVIPIDNDGNIVMVEQYRHASKQITLEIPAGTLEKNEDPLVCAKRELEEETGYKSDNIEFLIKFYSAIGFCDEIIHVYVARNLQISKMNLDEDEFVTLKKYSLNELIQKIFSGEIIDNKTISSILAYNYQINQKK